MAFITSQEWEVQISTLNMVVSDSHTCMKQKYVSFAVVSLIVFC